MKKYLGFLATVFIAVFSTANAATYWVDPAGSGTTCSFAVPCTLSYALTTKIANNDVVEVLPGTYSISSQITQKTGTTGIIVEGSNPANSANWPVLDGAGLTTGRMIYSTGGTFRYLKVKNVSRAAGYTKAAFIADDNAPNVTIENNIISNVGNLLEYKGNNDIVRNNYIYRPWYSALSDNGIDAGETVSVYRNIFHGGSLAKVGAATGGDGDTLIDTNTTWSATGVFSGAIIKNYTDGSWGIVKSWSGNTVEFVSAMSSGDWASGDRWELYGGKAQAESNLIIATGPGAFSIYNNTFSGNSGFPLRILVGLTGTAVVKNNLFLSSRGSANISSSAVSGVTIDHNIYLNGSNIGSGTDEFEGNLSGVTDSGVSTSVNWGVRPYVNYNDTYWTYRFDDAYYGTCADCTTNYYKDLAVKMAPYGAKGVIGIDVAEVGKAGNYLTWDGIRELVETYGWEMASHSLSHQSVDVTTRKTSPFAVTGPGSIAVAMSGTPPNDSGTITITEGANSLVITIPALPNLVYTAQRTTGADNDPWDHTVTNNGMPDPAAYDLGSLKGLRDYIEALPNWTATAFTGDTDFPENAPVRELATGTYNNPSSAAILFNPATFLWWEMKHSKDVLDAQIGNSYSTTSFIYPNFVLDYAAIAALHSYGYRVGMGYNMVSGQNIMDSLSTYNFGTNVMATIINADTDGNGTDGEEHDIRHSIRALANMAGGDNRAVGLISHERVDVDSMTQWDWIISEVAAQPHIKVKTADEISTIVWDSGLWTSVNDYLWERDYSNTINRPRLTGSSPAINAGAVIP